MPAKQEGLVLTRASCCCTCLLEALFLTGLFALFRGCPKHCRDVAVNFSNNLHVDILRILLIVNWLQEFVKARLPIFSCNLALALIANVQCINVLYYSCKCRLFYFCPNYLLLNFGKLFSGRYIRCSAQSIDTQQNSHFQSYKNTNSESGLTIDNQRITRCTPSSWFLSRCSHTSLTGFPQTLPRSTRAALFPGRAPHRPIAFSFHKSILFLVNFFQDDTLCATRILLDISDLGIFRVVKTTTLISAKQLIHSNLQVALQLRRHLPFVSMLICSWDFHGQKYGTTKKRVNT